MHMNSEIRDAAMSNWSPFSGVFRTPIQPYNSNQNGYHMQGNNNQFMRTHQAVSHESMKTAKSTSDGEVTGLSSLPNWTFDRERREVTYSLEQVVSEGLLSSFAQDKLGCKFLQENFPSSGPLKDDIYKFVMQKPGYFQYLSKDVFGNFFAQALVENADTDLLKGWILEQLMENMGTMCFNRYACRVVQKSFEIFPNELKRVLLREFSQLDMIKIAVDQNANHVVQKVIEFFEVHVWKFILDAFLADESSFFQVIESKYGCRVLQLVVEVLAKALSKEADRSVTCMMTESLMGMMLQHCERLASNEYANYVVQHIIATENLENYRDIVIEDCLLRNLLSFSQEKFASHVVEKALIYAPPELLYLMLEELFDGYLPDPQTNRECLDILLFHQYGNYVIQRMLLICIDLVTKMNREPRAKNGERAQRIAGWTRRLEFLIDSNAQRLTRYSSGKKLLELLEKFRRES